MGAREFAIGWWCGWARAVVVALVCGLVSAASEEARAGIARADVAPDGSPRNDVSYGLLAIASSVGPYHIRGAGQAFAETDTEAGTLQALSRGVNLQDALSSAELADTLTIVPLPGVVPTGPVSGTLILDFDADIDLDVMTGDLLESHALTAINTVELDRLSAAGSSTIIDRARTVKSYGELTQPISPTLEGPRTTFADQTTAVLAGTGIVDVYVYSRVRFTGRVMLPFTIPVGQPYYFKALIASGVGSGMGYIAYDAYANLTALSVQLPPDFTFTSDSGVLLSTAVPEPGVSLQLLVGAAAVAVGQRRRRRRQLR